MPVAGRPAAAPSPSQTEALAYTYAVTGALSNPTGSNGGKYNVYVVGEDTQGMGNEGSVGHGSDANHSAAFTFQLDAALNGGDPPIVSVSENDNVATDDSSVEQVSPMIITVDWAGEAGEYPGDSYRTVTLTEATLKVSFEDGTSDPTRTFDLTTEVSTQDSIKYTIPLVNPKVGTYTLTVKAEDSAGNTVSDGHSVTWKVVAAKAVPITLKPGWNLISLPFQPANPAINSVIPSDHPISLVMTFDGAQGVWLFSRRDAETGLFTGDVAAMTATAAYFVNTESFEPLELLRPPLATAAAAPSQPPAIPVKAGWNLVPVSTSQTSGGIDADTYFGTLGASWLRALAWDSLSRAWIAVSRDEVAHTFDADGSSPDDDFQDRCGSSHDYEAPAANGAKATVGAVVCVGEGLWLWVTEDGTLIPG
jgi:hypothetical protein